MRLTTFAAVSLTLHRASRPAQASVFRLQHPFCTTAEMSNANAASKLSTTDAQDSDQAPDPALGLPEPKAESHINKLDMSSGQDTVALDHLGPMVVNVDGTLSRISNWGEMSEIEKKNTLRVLGKRNKARLEALKTKEDL